jgi:hypothetical protein
VNHSEERRVQRVSDPFPPPCTTLSSSSSNTRDLQKIILHTLVRHLTIMIIIEIVATIEKNKYKNVLGNRVCGCVPDYVAVCEVMHMCTVILLSEYNSHAEMLEPI